MHSKYLTFLSYGFFSILFFGIVTASLGQKKYASPSGLDSNSGESISQPLSLPRALSLSSPLSPGDSLVLLDGIYGGNFSVDLSGSDQSPIVIIPQHEGKVIIDTGINSIDGTGLTVNGSNIWLVGIHLTSSTLEKREDLGNEVLYETGISVFGNHVKLINCWVYDVPGSGLQLWRPSRNLEVYGCVIFNNGSQSPVRGTGHGMYIQHQDSDNPINLVNNVLFQNASQGINIYTTNPTNGGINLFGNVSFNTGVIANFNPLLFRPPHNFTVGSENNLSYEVEVKENIFYSDLQNGRLGTNQISNVTLGRSFQPNQDFVFQDNLLVGGRNQLEIQPLTGLELSGNRFYNLHGKFIQFLSDPVQSIDNNWNANSYFQPSSDLTPFSGLNFQDWKSQTNFDGGSKYEKQLPLENQIKVTRNKYDPRKFYVTIYNPSKNSQVQVDFSEFGIDEGAPYQLIDFQNPFDTESQLNSTLSNQRISFPMNFKKSLGPKGNMPHQPVHTDESFGVFQVTFETISDTEPIVEPDFKASFQVALNSEGAILPSISDYFNSALENDWEVTFSRNEVFTCLDLGIQPVRVTVKNSTGEEWSQEVLVEVIDTMAPEFEASDAYLDFDQTVGSITLSPTDFSIQEQNISDNCLASGGVSVELDRTTLTCEDLTGEPISVKITVADNAGNATSKIRKIYLNSVESKKVSVTSSGNLIEGEKVTLTLGDELEYEVAYWKRIGSSGQETFLDSMSKSIQVEAPGQYSALLHLASGCQVESERITIEQIDTQWPEVKENISLNLSDIGKAELSAGPVFDNWPVEGVSVSFSKTNFSCDNLGQNQVDATLSHPVWGEKNLTFELTIVDPVAPSFELQTPELKLDKITGVLEIDVQDFILSASDNCKISTVEIHPSQVTCEQIGKDVVFEITAKDPSGNQTKKQLSVTINEVQSNSLSISALTSGPYLAGETVELKLGNEFEYTVEGWYRNDQLLQGQKGNSLLVNQTGNYFAQVRPVKGCLVTSQAIQLTIPETEFGIIRPEVVLNLDPTGQVVLQPAQLFESWPLPSGFTATLSKQTFTCEDLGENEITILIKNEAGTTYEAKTTAIIQDLIAPQLKGAGMEVFLDLTLGSLEIQINELITEVADNCGIKEASPAQVTLTCEDLAKTKDIKISATDFSGNKTELIVPVTVKPKEGSNLILAGQTEVCQGEISTLEVKGEAEFEVVAWRKNGIAISGQTQKTLSITESGSYQALIRYPGACFTETEVVTVQFNPKPSGEIKVEGNRLSAPEGFTYQWYRNDELMPGETDQTLSVDSRGEYKVLLKSESDCEAFLDPVTITISGIALPWSDQAIPLKIYPNPAKDFATIELIDEPIPNLDRLKIYTGSGVEVTDWVQIISHGKEKLELSLTGMASGTYLLTWSEPDKKAYFGRLIILK